MGSAASSAAPRPLHLLVIGDSITHHQPMPEKLGWSGNWGMAASTEAKDYAHLFAARLAQETGVAPVTQIEGEGGGKLAGQLKLAERFVAAHADIAVIQMGENDRELTEESFQRPYEQIVEAIRKGNPKARIFCFAVWAPLKGSPFKDAMIHEVCRHQGATFVELRDAYADPLNQAGAEKRFTHPGVNWHPGDRGMQAYANALWSAYCGEQRLTAASGPAESSASTWRLTEDWSDATTGLAWSVPPPTVVEGKRRVAKFTAVGAETNLNFQAGLPAPEIAGHVLVIKAQVKTEGLSATSDANHGPTLALRWLNAEGEHDYQRYAHWPGATADWKEIVWEVNVPGNVVGVQLELGLARAAGTLWVGEAELTVKPR